MKEPLEVTNALNVLVNYLQEIKTEHKYTLEYEDSNAYYDNDGEYHPDSSPAANIARDYANVLLSAANANGLGGCRLCRG